MTPAINTLKRKKIAHTIHQYKHEPKHESYGLEAAEKLDINPKYIYKTLVVQTDSNTLVVAVIPVEQQLNMKLVAKAVQAKKATMADKNKVQKTTGYVLGGVSPVGQKKRLQTLLCQSAENIETIFVSAGKRGLEIELKPADLLSVTTGTYAVLVNEK